jgi:FKBP-type peptidyl-prolyl cis-trans isomerase 2
MIKKNDKVAVEYEGRFEDGEVFDTSQHEGHSHPLVFVAGAGEVIPGFDNAVIGMKQGEEKEVTIQPKEAYGEYDARLTQEVPKTEFNLPRNQQPHVGMTLMMQSPHGDTIPVYVKAVGKDLVTLDLNHPLAGKVLIFKLKVVGINETVKEEAHSH